MWLAISYTVRMCTSSRYMQLEGRKVIKREKKEQEKEEEEDY